MRCLRFTIFATLMSASAAPTASAHCYTHWSYPWPQHCSMGAWMRPLIAVRPQSSASNYQEAQSKSAEDKSWYVDIAVTPALLDTLDHDEALQKLKSQDKNR